jgi:putative oxidoreductase
MDKLKLPLRLFLGAIYLIFGLNFFFQFIPMPPPPEKLLTFIMALVGSGYLMLLVKVLEIVFGALLLGGLFVPLGLIVLAPISLNIFLVHLLLDGVGPGLFMALAMLIAHVGLGVIHFDHYRSLFRAK